MPKPKRVRYSDVAVFCDAPGRILSRVQSFTADTDKSVEEMRELSNESITEYVEGLPVVSVSVDTSEIGGLRNLGALCNASGASYIDKDNFDLTSVDLAVQIEEDGVLARTMYMGDCFLTGISWSFDVGGVASENFTLESDNKTQYFDTKKEMFITTAAYGENDTTGSGVTTIEGSGWAALHTGLFITVDNEIIRSAVDKSIKVPDLIVGSGGFMRAAIMNSRDSAVCTPIISGGTRYRVGFYKDTPGSVIDLTSGKAAGAHGLDGSSIGGVRKGMVEIYLIPSGVSSATGLFSTSASNEILRLQTVSVDVDLSRESLEELGNYKAYYRSMVLPIPVTVTLSAIESDIDNWCRMSAGFKDTWPSNAVGTAGEISFRDFVKGASLHVKIYDDDESASSRNALKSVLVQELTATAESFSVDAGGNATADITCNADNFAVSGW